MMQKITPFLWFDDNAEEAVQFYILVFKNSKMGTISRYDEASAKAAGRPAGSVMVASFTIEGQEFTALNGGPGFKFNESVSFVVTCASQEEIDYYWDKLSEGGDEKAQMCGWLKDKFGLSWQIVPKNLSELLKNPNAMKALMTMKKLNIDELKNPQ